MRTTRKSLAEQAQAALTLNSKALGSGLNFLVVAPDAAQREALTKLLSVLGVGNVTCASSYAESLTQVCLSPQPPSWFIAVSGGAPTEFDATSDATAADPEPDQESGLELTPTQSNVLAFVQRHAPAPAPHAGSDDDLSDKAFAEGLRKLLIGERRRAARMGPAPAAHSHGGSDEALSEKELADRLRALLLRERRRAPRTASNQNAPLPAGSST